MVDLERAPAFAHITCKKSIAAGIDVEDLSEVTAPVSYQNQAFSAAHVIEHASCAAWTCSRPYDSQGYAAGSDIVSVHPDAIVRGSLGVYTARSAGGRAGNGLHCIATCAGRTGHHAGCGIRTGSNANHAHSGRAVGLTSHAENCPGAAVRDAYNPGGSIALARGNPHHPI